VLSGGRSKSSRLSNIKEGKGLVYDSGLGVLELRRKRKQSNALSGCLAETRCWKASEWRRNRPAVQSGSAVGWLRTAEREKIAGSGSDMGAKEYGIAD